VTSSWYAASGRITLYSYNRDNFNTALGKNQGSSSNALMDLHGSLGGGQEAEGYARKHGPVRVLATHLDVLDRAISSRMAF
jgi:hypothetical protein